MLENRANPMMLPQQNHSGPSAPQADNGYPRRRWRFSGMTWIWIGLIVLFGTGGILSMFVKNARKVPRDRPSAVSPSYFGVDGFENAEGGVTFDAVEPADGPADKAGLVGGDTINSFDGHPVRTSDELTDLLRQTPIGKRVEVIYTRDGNSHKTQLTTISEDEFNRLRDVGNQPAGMFGFARDATTRITIPETKTYGLRLDHVIPNSPADLFGIKAGDIITEFDKIPIRTSRELLSRVRRAIPRSTVEVVVLRGPEANRQTLKISVTMGRSG